MSEGCFGDLGRKGSGGLLKIQSMLFTILTRGSMLSIMPTLMTSSVKSEQKSEKILHFLG